ncbi:MAG: DUF177 domain-containing protein [Leptothrix ochracea]|uniref:YceD family protein n=1 Tax=Leptothrix ochracea TaxID=735331 RepID=UPI0034E3000F
MKSREFTPERLDILAFATDHGTLEGNVDLQTMLRLRAGFHAAATDPSTWPQGHWQATAELRPQTKGAPQVWLHLQAQTAVPLECQRCLQTVQEPLSVDRWFRFVATEAEAEQLDTDADEDILVISRTFDLLALIEDEWLLAQPLVPVHPDCELAFTGSDTFDDAANESEASQTPHPFAALAKMKLDTSR